MLIQKAYQCDENKIYVGEVLCQESPEEPGVWLCPAGATFTQPPAQELNKNLVYDFVNNTWYSVDIPVAPVAEPAKTFKQLAPEEKRAQILTTASGLVATCTLAMERMQWADWAGNPVTPELKKAWFDYRKSILAIPTPAQDTSFFISLQTAEDFPWPLQPEMPSEAI